MNCSRNDNIAKYLRKCASLAVSMGVTLEAFIAPIIPSMKAAAQAAYEQAASKAAK